ncbi:MAG: DUF2127 domain-containing protein [Proteobacteria bacterium]|nr:DUF2127 domain-containing protein [Pseudomonadota bacterium]
MKQGEGYLKLIILYKSVMGVCELILSVVLLRLLDRDLGVLITGIADMLGLDSQGYLIGYVVVQATLLGDGAVLISLIVLVTFGVLNLIESYGLHNRMRWAEWLTVIGTGALIPYEVYEIFKAFSGIKVLVLVINSLIVYFLAKHKELFKRRRPRGA